MSLPPPLEGLLEPGAYPHPVRDIVLIETPISWVLLTGEYAYKIKRPVHYSFVDLTDAAHREFLCHEEVRLNRRFAPSLYLAVVPITLAGGRARLRGRGEPIEHAVRLREFDRAATLDRLLARGTLAPTALADFGGALAEVHAHLPVAHVGDAWGQPEATRALIARNAADCAEVAHRAGLPAPAPTLCGTLATRLDAAMPLLPARLAAGRVRECHADLHAGNIVLHEGRLQAFDCLEFDPLLRWIDVADEIAFLLMDLEVRAGAAHAHAFLDAWLAVSGDFEACALLPLYGAHRALVRAKVCALGAGTGGAPGAAAATDAARQYGAYLDAAAAALKLRTPRLILMCGLSGSGKTWLARQLAGCLPALHLRSDVERKRLAELAPLARTAQPVAGGLYDGRTTAAVYAHLARCAAAALAGGLDLIVDATFAQREERGRFAALAASHHARAFLVHCHAPGQVLRARLEARERRGDDPSDAGTEVLAWQEKTFEPPAADEPLAVLEADTAAPDVAARVLAAVGGRSPGPAAPQLR